MAKVFAETFEGSEYDAENAWTEVQGTGCTINGDGAVANAGSPPNWGTYCMELFHAASVNNYAYDQFGDGSVRYFRGEVVFTDLSALVANGNKVIAFGSSNNSLATSNFGLHAYHDGTNLRLQMRANLNGAGFTDYLSDNLIVEDQVYRVEVKWDSTADQFEWRVDGISQDTAALTAGHVEMGTIFIGGVAADNPVAGQMYIDLIYIDDAGWVGPEPWKGKVSGVSNPAKVLGVARGSIKTVMGVEGGA